MSKSLIGDAFTIPLVAIANRSSARSSSKRQIPRPDFGPTCIGSEPGKESKCPAPVSVSEVWSISTYTANKKALAGQYALIEQSDFQLFPYNALPSTNKFSFCGRGACSAGIEVENGLCCSGMAQSLRRSFLPPVSVSTAALETDPYFTTVRRQKMELLRSPELLFRRILYYEHITNDKKSEF